jgi:protein-S-isoprenylcysteine O-methyltransferase Ste14
VGEKPSASEEISEVRKVSPSVNARVLVRFLVFTLLYPAVLFLTAGTLKWAWGWAYYLVLMLSQIGGRALVLRRHPELFAERAAYRTQGDAKDWDQVMVRIVALYGPLVTWVVAGLDYRWSWSPGIPSVLRWIALAIVLLGALLANWAMVANRFFSAIVRIQHDRGHQVVSDGPYRFVRHPGYAGGTYTWLAAPLMLGTLWAYIPALLTVCALTVRTALEDRTLIEELPGYAEYTRQTRYRLLPGVW